MRSSAQVFVAETEASCNILPKYHHKRACVRACMRVASKHHSKRRAWLFAASIAEPATQISGAYASSQIASCLAGEERRPVLPFPQERYWQLATSCMLLLNRCLACALFGGGLPSLLTKQSKDGRILLPRNRPTPMTLNNFPNKVSFILKKQTELKPF